MGWNNYVVAKYIDEMCMSVGCEGGDARDQSEDLFVMDFISRYAVNDSAAVYLKVENLADLDNAMDEAFAMKDRLVFMDIFIDRMEHVYPMHVAPNGSMKDMWLSKNERT